jgi:uncharacterized protein involved in exopolysaccharide biosynthesis
MSRDNDEIQLKEILISLSEYKVFLLKKKFSIIICSCLFLLFGLAYYFVSESKYNADLTFIVEQETGTSLGSFSGVASQFGIDMSGAENSTFSQNNILELLKSRRVIVSTLMQSAKVNGETDLLIEHYLKLNKIKEHWESNDEFSVVSFHDNSSCLHDSISGVIWKNIIKNDLTIQLQSTDANIIYLSYISLDQEFAKEFVENLIKQLSKMYTLHKTEQANNTLDFLQDRADSVFAELEAAEQEFARVKDINQRIIKATGRLKELQLMRRVEVLNAMYLEIVKNREIAKLTLLNQTPKINIIDAPILPLENNKISKKSAAAVGGVLGFFFSLCYFIFGKLFQDALK